MNYQLAMQCIGTTVIFNFYKQELCKILPTLPNLMELDVRLNGITKLGFLALTKAFSQANLQSDSMSSQAPPSVVVGQKTVS